MTPNPKRRWVSFYKNSNHHCIFCSRLTWEKARQLDAFRCLEAGVSPQRTYDLCTPNCRTGEKCSRCKRFVCSDCINFIVNDFQRKNIAIPKFFLRGGKEIGPCCWLLKKE